MMLHAQELAPAALCSRSCLQFSERSPCLGNAQSASAFSEGQGACHILSHLERGLENKSPFVTHSRLGRNALTFLSQPPLTRDSKSILPCLLVPSQAPAEAPPPQLLKHILEGAPGLSTYGACSLLSESLGHLLEGFLKLRKGGGSHRVPPSPIQLPSLNCYKMSHIQKLYTMRYTPLL